VNRPAVQLHRQQTAPVQVSLGTARLRQATHSPSSGVGRYRLAADSGLPNATRHRAGSLPAMWCTVLMLALVATMDPVRLGTSALLYSRPRPVRHLVAFWLGGVTVCIVLALGVLVGLRDVASGAIHRVQHATTGSTVGHIQIAMGALALLVAAFTVGLSPRRRARLAWAASSPSGSPSTRQPRSPTAMSRLSTRAQNALQNRPLWVPFVLGVGLFTDFRYLLALSAIVASGATAGVEVTATAAFAVVSLAFIEIPLASQLAAPEKTGEIMSQAHAWVKARRHQVFALIIALVGVFLVTTGMGHI